MEGQQRANAAQLAARNIKAAKGSRRKTPLKPNGAVQQSMPFGGDGGGGLFGGGVQATGTFNFSAPGGGGLSFPPSPFGNGNMIPGGGVSSPDTSENESDPRADTTGEEAARRKKDFRVGNDQGSQPASFHTPNAFGGNQPANPLSQAGSQGSQTGNIFSFQPSMSQPPASPAFNFGSTSTQEKPASNPFTFGASQPAPSSPATGFGAGSTQDKPGNNIFGSFGQQQPAQPAPSSIFNFGSPATKDKPAVPSTPFTFGQSSTQPSSSGISFGATPAAEKPTTSIFGTPQPTPSANPFGSLSQPASPSMSFGSTQAAEKPTTNIFGNPQPQPTPTNIFGSLGQQSTPSNMFANPTTSAPPASNVFGQLEQQPAPNSSSLFGGQGQQQNANILFGNSNQAPATPSAAEEPKSQPTPSSNIFGNLNNPPPSSTSLFSSPNKQSAPASTLFGGSNIQTTSTGDLFGHLNKPVDQKLDQPKVNGNSLNGTSSKTDSLPSTSNTIGSSLFSQAPSSNLFGQSKQSFPASGAAQSDSNKAPKTPTITFGAKKTSFPSTTDTAKKNVDDSTSPVKPFDTPKPAPQAPASGMFSTTSQPTQKQPEPNSSSVQPTLSTSSASANGLPNGNSTQVADRNKLYEDMAAAARITDEFMQPLVPARFNEEQRKEFYIAYRMRSLNKAMQGFFTSLDMGTEISNALAFYHEQRLVIMGGSPDSISGPKRKAANDEDHENENPIKRNKQAEASDSKQPEREQTAKSPEKSSGGSKHLFSNGTASPKAPPLAAPQSFTPNLASSSSPTKGKRKAEVQLTKDDDERDERESRRLDPKLNGTTSGSNTSNIFKNILGSPSKASPEKKQNSLPDVSKDDAPRFNPFASLPVPASPTSLTSTGSAPPAVSSNNPFASKPTSTTANPFSPKPTSTAANPFSPKPSSSIPSTTASSSAAPSPIKPPNFGTGPVNFLAQFNQQASKSEEELMEKEKAEDMDSDEDEQEWEARWKEKRKAQLKSIEEVAKSKRATFTGGKFTFGQEDGSSTSKATTADTSAASSDKSIDATQESSSKTLFASNPTAGSPGNSMFGSVNGSRTPTPGLAGSNTGSVLDGHVPGKPVSFGKNIFSHLSDADSGADSAKGDEKDESADEETEAEEDSENKDPGHRDSKDKGKSDAKSNETSQGITPAKKPLFDFGASKSSGVSGASSISGTSTPGGSLFDRITRDSTGNPIRQVSSEEKENAKPNTTTNVAETNNPFSKSFTESSDAPADQTWKPDSPIKFGANPTVNVTAATPTKQATPFANLFGNSGSSEPSSSANGSPKPFSNLFGNSTTSKSPSTSGGVGFNFGGQSTTTSSLFPSAAASTTTSRATSPGGTTDGDSAAEGDPDAEQHEQINLTAGGPGEENEDILHEVRAKALQWISKDGVQWQTKGVGPLRVLKHKETNATRILLRADPSGTIVLNKSLLAGVKYEVNEKTIKFLAAGEEGKSLETWLLQVKTAEFAKKLGEVLEANKPSS